MPGLTSYRLGALVDAFGLAEGLPSDLRPHRAGNDALVCGRLLIHLATTVHPGPVTLADLLTPKPVEEVTNHASPADTLF